jgi:hypothetical protein
MFKLMLSNGFNHLVNIVILLPTCGPNSPSISEVQYVEYSIKIEGKVGS